MRRERPRERGEGLAVVGVGHLDPEPGKAPADRAGGGDDRGHAVRFAQREGLDRAHHLAREHEASELQVLAQLHAHVVLMCLEDGERALGPRLHESLDAHLGRRRGDLLRAFALEAGAAIEQQARRLHAGRACRKRRKKLSVVARATSSNAMPRSAAISSATCFTNAGWLGLPRCGTGARYGESVSTSMRSSGTRFATSFRSFAFLNVTMPEKEMWNPWSMAPCATSHVSVKQCMTPPTSPAPSSRMTRSVSSAALRVWITSGLARLRAARMCVRNRSRCHSVSPSTR